jgi:hypothetical protein
MPTISPTAKIARVPGSSAEVKCAISTAITATLARRRQEARAGSSHGGTRK